MDQFPTHASHPEVVSQQKHAWGAWAIAVEPVPVPNSNSVISGLDLIPVLVWLVTHRELHTSRRIRLLFDHLAEVLSGVSREQAATRDEAS